MAFFQDFRPAHEPFLRAPTSVLVLIGVLVAAHVVRVLEPQDVSQLVLSALALNPIVYDPAGVAALGFPPPTLFAQLVPPLGHVFVHGDTTQLILNCLWLLVFGTIVGQRFGSVGFYLLFVLCALAGGGAFVAIAWGHNTGAVGASGAIAGLMGAAIRMFRLRELWLRGATMPMLSLLSDQVVWFSAVWLVINLLAGMFGQGPDGTVQAIAWQDQLGGYLAGLVLAGPFDRLFGPDFARRAG